jgi:GNAT superfamily N-acetyltransferase
MVIAPEPDARREHLALLTIEALNGQAAMPYLGDLAALRTEVFREFPYLYEGTPEYEQRYLKNYAEHARSVIVLARDGDQVVGASTAMPLTEHGENMTPVLAKAGFDPERIYYFGESVLRASYRGRGIGHAFFDQREAAAKKHGFGITAFCAVMRPSDHPLRPADYVPHDAFWSKRGYAKRDDIVASFEWRDLGEAEETHKPMVFWLKELRA